jgi:hypothetical protein
MKTNFFISIRKHLLNAALGTIFGISALFSQSQNWWRTNGNTPQSTDFLGTSNNSPLIIKTNNLERLRIAPNGFIGISNANPQYPLDVNGRTKLRFNVYCDSLLYSSNLVVNNSIQTSTIDAHVYLVNGSPAVFSQWTTLSPNSIAFNGDVYVNTLNAQSGISIGNFKFKNGALPPQRDTIRSDKMVSFVADKSIEFRADTVRFADKVGIGKQPTAALDVNGDVAISGTMKVGNLPISTDSVANIVVVDNAGNLKTLAVTLAGPGNPPPPFCPPPISSAFWYVGGNILNPLGCNVIGSGNAADISIITNGARRINITADGRIGFNISAPPQITGYIDPVAYEFNGSVSIRDSGNASLFFGRDNLTGSGTVAEFYGEWGIQYVKTSDNNNQGGGLNFWKPFQSTGANGNGFLWLGDNGNVGIGCTNPQYLLDVNGTLRAKEVRVKITGCDFVFEDNYSLASWKERKKEVLQSKHLPNIPNVKGEKDVNSSELLQGIWRNTEEHELYLYQLFEAIEKLQKEVEQLKKENEMLKRKLDK